MYQEDHGKFGVFQEQRDVRRITQNKQRANMDSRSTQPLPLLLCAALIWALALFNTPNARMGAAHCVAMPVAGHHTPTHLLIPSPTSDHNTSWSFGTSIWFVFSAQDFKSRISIP